MYADLFEGKIYCVSHRRLDSLRIISKACFIAHHIEGMIHCISYRRQDSYHIVGNIYMYYISYRRLDVL